MNAADEQAYNHFRETLNADLTQNIKPVIISLTMLAEDYHRSGKVIAQSIDEYIRQASLKFSFCVTYEFLSIYLNSFVNPYMRTGLTRAQDTRTVSYGLDHEKSQDDHQLHCTLREEHSRSLSLCVRIGELS